MLLFAYIFVAASESNITNLSFPKYWFEANITLPTPNGGSVVGCDVATDTVWILGVYILNP